MRSKTPSQIKRSYAASQSSFVPSPNTSCEIVAIAKRRDGGTRYWCLRHKADATAKYGRPSESCRAAHLELDRLKAFDLDIDLYNGGVALWGAVPAVYDTTRRPMETGIHVHARRSVNNKKEIDDTFRAVRIVGSAMPTRGLDVFAIDAIYYMVSSVFGFEMSQAMCKHCGEPHLDREWFSVHPHSRHLCGSCGKIFKEAKRGIGNPICGLREAFGVKPDTPRSANRRLVIRQVDFPGGIQIWGSSPALIWTGNAAEEEGIHLHAFRNDEDEEEIDETFSEVIIDGIKIDPAMVRILMAQNTLPYLQGRVKSMKCRYCCESVFSTGEFAFTPVGEHKCKTCGRAVKASGRLRNTIGNPLPANLARLAQHALRAPQSFTLNIQPELAVTPR